MPALPSGSGTGGFFQQHSKAVIMKDIYEAAGKRELFIDDFLIEQKRGLSFRQHSPVEQPSCPDKPVGHYLTVMKDPEKYWIFYRDVDSIYKGP